VTTSPKDENDPTSFLAGQWTLMPRGNNTPTLQEKTLSGMDKKCVCRAAKTKEHNWKTCQYVRQEILRETYLYGSKVDKSYIKWTRGSLKKDKFRKLVQKILTGDEGATSERGKGDSPNFFNYNDTEMPEYSGFNVAKQASPIVDCC
jgi:hypothetical protein